jgi:dihydropyrimidinase
MSYDLVVRGGTVVTASDSFAADIGVRSGRVAAIGEALAPGTTEIAAAGLLVLPAESTCIPISTLRSGGCPDRR